jgi:hypothetical protein
LLHAIALEFIQGIQGEKYWVLKERKEIWVLKERKEIWVLQKKGEDQRVQK